MLAHMAQDTLDVEKDVWREPGASFVSQDRHEADLAMLRRSPHVVGWAGEVGQPGEYIAKDLLGMPIVITRARDGVLRAFFNACAHRGAVVAEGCGKTRTFVCSYHGWTYGLDGRLTGAPARKMFDGADLDSRGLRELPISERCGLLTVGLADDVDVESHLEDVENTFAEYNFAERRHFETRRYEVAANWKLNIDINFEGYHIKYAHPESLFPLVTNNSVIDTFGRHCRFAFPFRQITDFQDQPEDSWLPDFMGILVWHLFPTTVLVEVPGSVQMIRVYPGPEPGRSITHLSQGTLTPITTDADREWYTNLLNGNCAVLVEEDFPQAESCQMGLQTGLDHVVFGRNEPLLQHMAAVWQGAITEFA
ncbi:aromatic ring-hydroxylating dioxygenase subunit alpha [Mycobacterium sp. 94-17]|uniref:aromatic ring-hydroxylating oxygenase subunit alpha n=1 Tax=Mycobacterium sp. 94-17 TaxID=2986147 RepID=UPI002D1F5A21|nr:aromatic ring-hydroxylating dioxygenase subunit alpha [Mycobacterium sp. 94-17]MEB4207738.1 aromatic ring-hydroxylating dioxygenase subunit alpha [Mycobacterium sp. 94-17]